MRLFAVLAISVTVALITGCASLTRTEQDVFTITEKDTVSSYFVKNAPGNRDNGIIYPSSKEIRTERALIQRDSVIVRYYPNFIRLGLFETIGTIGGNGDYGLGTGLFGIFQDFNNLNDKNRGSKGNLFTGGIWRFGVAEWRLRWFRDAENWTIGTSAFEVLAPDARGEMILAGAFPIQIRKRYYLRDKIPYVTLTPLIDLSYLPSQYLNLALSLDVGSIGGLNVRSYIGLALGYNGKYTPQIRNNDFTDEGETVIYPYLGIGMSVLDFHNRVEETQKEWKYHEHSGWDIGFMQFSFLHSGADIKDNPFNSINMKIANSYLALPVLDYKLYAGTSLVNYMSFSSIEYFTGVLPIRIGYWQTLIADELIAEPFAEYNYYPDSFFNIGLRVNLRIFERSNLSLLIGHASGTNEYLNEYVGGSEDVSRSYIGIGLNLLDRIFYRDHLRYDIK